MSFIDDINIYNDPIISTRRKGNSNDPFKQIIETLTVENGKVLLTEIPNTKERVVVKNGSAYLIEVDEGTLLTANTFYVDYPNGIVSFYSSLNNQSLDFTYLGEGARLFPSARIYLEDDKNNIINAKDKFSDIDRLIDEQKARVDVQIQSVPQPYEILDIRVDRNGITYDVAKDRIDAEQLKIDTVRDEIDASYTDESNNKYISLSDRFNSIDSDIQAFQQNITSLSDSLSLKVNSTDFTGENIVSKIELTPGNILISANKIDLNGAIGINALGQDVQNVINDKVLKSAINLTDTLPTAIMMDTNGITAYTSDVTKYARLNQNGLYIKGGALSIERSDGYTLVNSGVANFDFSIDSHEPPFMDLGVTQDGWWFKTNSTNYLNANFYSYRHTGRYLHMSINGGSDAGGGQMVAIFDQDGVTKLGEYLNGEWIDNTYQPGRGDLNFSIDLGVPTGQIRSFYLRFKSTVTGVNTYVRVMRKWLEG